MFSRARKSVLLTKVLKRSSKAGISKETNVPVPVVPPLPSPRDHYL